MRWTRERRDNRGRFGSADESAAGDRPAKALVSEHGRLLQMHMTVPYWEAMTWDPVNKTWTIEVTRRDNGALLAEIYLATDGHISSFVFDGEVTVQPI